MSAFDRTHPVVLDSANGDSLHVLSTAYSVRGGGGVLVESAPQRPVARAETPVAALVDIAPFARHGSTNTGTPRENTGRIDLPLCVSLGPCRAAGRCAGRRLRCRRASPCRRCCTGRPGAAYSPRRRQRRCRPLINVGRCRAAGRCAGRRCRCRGAPTCRRCRAARLAVRAPRRLQRRRQSRPFNPGPPRGAG